METLKFEKGQMYIIKYLNKTSYVLGEFYTVTYDFEKQKYWYWFIHIYNHKFQLVKYDDSLLQSYEPINASEYAAYNISNISHSNVYGKE